MKLIFGLGLYLLTGIVLTVIAIIAIVTYTAVCYEKGDHGPGDALEKASDIWHEPELAGEPLWRVCVTYILFWPVRLPTGIAAVMDMFGK